MSVFVRKELADRLFETCVFITAETLGRTISNLHATLTLGNALGLLKPEDKKLFKAINEVSGWMFEEIANGDNLSFQEIVGDVLFPAVTGSGKLGAKILEQNDQAAHKLHFMEHTLRFLETRYKTTFASSILNVEADAS